MISFLGHLSITCLIGGVSIWVVHAHETDAKVAFLLEFLVMTSGGAAILHRLQTLLGAAF
jgi:divalent metal cation (Fe/Co/Zn/Cd) transporter